MGLRPRAGARGGSRPPPARPAAAPSRPWLVLALIAIGVGWGSTQSLGKIAVSTGHQHLGLIFWQSVVCVLVLGGLNALRRRRFAIDRAGLRFALVVALVGTLIPNSTFYLAVAHLPGGVMSIIVSTVPLLALPMAVALGIDRIDGRRLLGLGCGLAGVLLMALPRTSLPAPDMAAWLPLALVGPLFYAFEGNYIARWGTAGLDAVQAMFWASVLAGALSLPLAVLDGQWIPAQALLQRPGLALIASSVVHALVYAGYLWLAGQAGAVFATQVSYVVTGSGLVWAMALLGERFSAWIWLALAVVLLGLFLVQPRPVRATPG